MFGKLMMNKSDCSYFSEEQLTKENSSSLFYLINIYMTPVKTYYSSFYTNIQDVIDEIGGLIVIFSSVIRIFCNWINSGFQKFKYLIFYMIFMTIFILIKNILIKNTINIKIYYYQ